MTEILHIAVLTKPFEGTFAENALAYGSMGLNVDACRIRTEEDTSRPCQDLSSKGCPGGGWANPLWAGRPCDRIRGGHGGGRWPANVMLHHHPECVSQGTLKIRANKEGAGILWSHLRDDKVDSARAATSSVGDVDGNESVENWKCHLSCPVTEINGGASSQSGGEIGKGFGSPTSRYFKQLEET